LWRCCLVGNIIADASKLSGVSSPQFIEYQPPQVTLPDSKKKRKREEAAIAAAAAAAAAGNQVFFLRF
jgi:hypothetical protein